MDTTSNDRIEKQIELNAPVARVWRALTDHEEFGAWFKVDLEAPFAPGQTTRGKITYPGYEHLVMEVVVQRMEPERLFSFHWYPTGDDPDTDLSKETPTLVEFKLERLGDGTLLKGRVRRTVHRPEASRFSTTSSRESSASRPCGNEVKDSSSSPSSSTTTDRSILFSPRLMAATVPQPGEVYRTPGVFLSVKRTWPSFTLSPTFTAMVGFIPP